MMTDRVIIGALQAGAVQPPRGDARNPDEHVPHASSQLEEGTETGSQARVVKEAPLT